ncbi:MAG: TetR/AcrR family transcriptional regulator [Lachnospiraceae bacterium]|nr:TetR/AcrR family transcriptional regulator [Lachnospiraceae bacterium]
MEAIKQKIIGGGMAVYKRKGPKFTMDDLASELSMSKKTIYTVYRDKKALLYDMVEYTFDEIKRAEQTVIDNEELGTLEKLRGILGVMPEGFREMDFTVVDTLKDKYPEVYKRVNERIESEWDTTLALLKQGIGEGIFKEVNLPVFQMIYEATLERFLHGSELKKNNVRYMDALNELVDIMIDGIRNR